MAKRNVHLVSLVGPGVSLKNQFVDVRPGYRFVDAGAVNWPDAVTYQFDNGELTIYGLEDTFGDLDVVWVFQFRNLDSRNQPIGPARIEQVDFVGTSGTTVEYTDMHQVEEYIPPEYMPAIYTQTVEARDAAMAAQSAAEAAAAAAAAVGATSDAQVAVNVKSGPKTSTAVRVSARQAKGALCLQFDDAIPDHWTVVAPLIEAAGGRATFAIDSDRIANPAGTSTSLAHAKIADLASRGHEIACHSKTHTNMTTLTPTTRIPEWDTSRGILQGITGLPVTTWVYPNNTADAATESEAYLRYDRTFAGKLVDYAPTLATRSRAQMNGRFAWSGQSYAHPKALELVRLAAATDSVVTIFTHQVDGSNLTFGVTNAQLVELVNLAVSLGLPLLTASEAIPAYANIPDAGFEDAAGFDIHWLRNGVTAGNAIDVVTDAPMTGYPGAKSLRITGNGTGFPYASMRETFMLRSSAQHTISARARQEKTSGSSGLYIQGVQKDRFGATVGTAADTKTTTLNTVGSTVWQQISKTFTPDPAAVAIDLQIVQGTMVGTSFIDHIHVGPTSDGALG